MTDTISRAAAINELERKKDKNAKGDVGGFYNKIIQNDIDTLMRLPSAQPIQRGWICPVCGRGLSPFTTVCPCQNGKGWEITCKT